MHIVAEGLDSAGESCRVRLKLATAVTLVSEPTVVYVYVSGRDGGYEETIYIKGKKAQIERFTIGRDEDFAI